ncbi:MAG: C1 family peptidase [Bacteroidota bacterium]|nr:C1 family peptidase [Bacteroidota bacterium]
MRTLIFITVLIFSLKSYSQPSTFSWFNYQSSKPNYISPAKDQGEQDPCAIFAAVAAIEALSHIYYNKPFPYNSSCLNLSEAELYSICSGYGRFEGAANAMETLNYSAANGIVDDVCFPYPTESSFFRDPCNKCSTPSQKVKVPGCEELFFSSNQELKRAIINYGPIIVSMQNVGNILHPDKGCPSCGHTVLIVGWDNNLGWHIKDSWPGDYWIYFNNIDVFDVNRSSKFYRAKFESGGNVISCTGGDCTTFSSRSCVDNDGDGFYNWGIGAKPSGYGGPCKMDFNDSDPTKIFLDNNYNELPTPTITGSDYVCQSGSTFQLNNLPSGFSVSWQVSPSVYFNSPISGTSTTATIYPSTQYAGDECTINYTISDGCGSANYSKKFTINGPEKSKVSINVVESYAQPPVLYSEVWLLCPNSSYYI